MKKLASIAAILMATPAFAANITCTTVDFYGEEGNKDYSISFPREDYQEKKLDLRGSVLGVNKIELSITGNFPGNRRFLRINVTQPSGAKVSAEGLASDQVTLDFMPVHIFCRPTE